MTLVTPQSRVQCKPDVLSVEINGETVTMNVNLAEYYGLDPIASDIWQRLAQRVTVAQLVQDLAKSYEGDPAIIQIDVLALLDAFAAKDLLIVEA
ncbi:MAG: PqqD family protein [Azospirillaceae bacterium]|nr:PqqD family protein [Azospirillaceae bacterium]